MPGLLLAQTNPPPESLGATVSGVITGPSSAAVPNAKIVVRNVSTNRSTPVQADPSGKYTVSKLPPGNYEITVNADGFQIKSQTVQLTIQKTETLDFSLVSSSASSSGSATEPTLGELGFPATQGNAQEQALLDRRSHMLMIHQRLGLITLAPLLATLITSANAGGHHSSTTGRDLHAALGGVALGMYFATASYAIRAPRVAGTTTRGPIRLHKTLAWVHGTGMILTPILGIMAYNQLNRGERVHGIASAHGPVAWTTSIAYGAALLSVSFKF